jgi:hypothetical protein
MVSGSVSLLCSRCFSPFPHGTGSLSVSQEYLALADGAARFRQGFTGPALLRILIRYIDCFAYGTITPYGPSFQMCSATLNKSMLSVLQPRYCLNNTGLGFFPFARHYLGNHYCFLLLRLLRCFSSAGSPPPYGGSPAFNRGGCPIRKSPDYSLFAATRSLSQLITSFFASESLGILHTLLLTFFQNNDIS